MAPHQYFNLNSSVDDGCNCPDWGKVLSKFFCADITWKQVLYDSSRICYWLTDLPLLTTILKLIYPVFGLTCYIWKISYCRQQIMFPLHQYTQSQKGMVFVSKDQNCPFGSILVAKTKFHFRILKINIYVLFTRNVANASNTRRQNLTLCQRWWCIWQAEWSFS